MTYTELDVGTPDCFPGHSPTAESFYPGWSAGTQGESVDFSSQQFLAAGDQCLDTDLLNQLLLEAQSFGATKSRVWSCPDPDIMLGREDPNDIYASYDTEMLRLLKYYCSEERN